MPPYKCPNCGRVYQTHEYCNHHHTSVLCDDIGTISSSTSLQNAKINISNRTRDIIVNVSSWIYYGGLFLLILYILYLFFIRRYF